MTTEARIHWTMFKEQVIFFTSPLVSLEDFIASLPRVPALECPTDEVDKCCFVCRQNLWPPADSQPSEEPLRLTCCGKIIGSACLKLWLSPRDNGKYLSIHSRSEQR